MALDFPVTGTYEGDSATCTVGQMASDPNMQLFGWLDDYRFSVWAPVASFSTPFRTGKKFTIAAVSGTPSWVTAGDYQIAHTADNDGVVVRLDLTDTSA